MRTTRVFLLIVGTLATLAVLTSPITAFADDEDKEDKSEKEQKPEELPIKHFYKWQPIAKRFHYALGVMALTNSTSQGGTGPGGSTVLTQSEFVYQYNKWLGFGGFGLFDLQGSSQMDIAVGPKIEGRWMMFHADVGYMAFLQRGFSDRSIARQFGSGWTFGIGVRVPIKVTFLTTPKNESLFLQFSYRYRIETLTYQDNTQLSDPITQTDGYPLFGIGYHF